MMIGFWMPGPLELIIFLIFILVFVLCLFIRKINRHLQRSTPDVITRKEDIGSKQITKKVKIYRILGWILSIYGIIGYVAYLLTTVLEEGIDLSYPAIAGALMSFVFNIFLWLGLIMLWRADENENPNKKSKWLRLIKAYIILTLTVIIAAITYPIFVRLAHTLHP